MRSNWQIVIRFWKIVENKLLVPLLIQLKTPNERFGNDLSNCKMCVACKFQIIFPITSCCTNTYKDYTNTCILTLDEWINCILRPIYIYIYSGSIWLMCKKCLNIVPSHYTIISLLKLNLARGKFEYIFSAT